MTPTAIYWIIADAHRFKWSLAKTREWLQNKGATYEDLVQYMLEYTPST